MSSSTSSSEAKASDTKGTGARTSAPMFLAAMLGGALLTVGGFSFAPEAWIHKAPEYGMAEAYEDHIEQACAKKIAPELLIIGDSRAVAGVSVEMIRAAGIDAEKFALGGAGIFAGWATLDRLIDCGVKPKTVVMAYGTIHMLDAGAIMDRTTNYDLLKGARTSHAYAMAAAWEDRPSRKIAYKVASILGTEFTGIDFALLRPALRNVLARPVTAIENAIGNARERESFSASRGDRFYGLIAKIDELPDEAEFTGEWTLAINWSATHQIGRMGKAGGFDVYFYILPISELAKNGLPPRTLEIAEEFRKNLKDLGVTSINDIWTLPDSDFGDPSHVNERGRARVTADFLRRLGERRSMVGDQEATPRAG
ncbi:MAG TPA: hypothetical protein VIA80_06010 [Hyphomonadaceae bacterium]